MNKPKPIPEKIELPKEAYLDLLVEDEDEQEFRSALFNHLEDNVYKLNEIIDYLDYLAKQVRDLKER